VQKTGIKVKPKVMIPLVGFKRELDLQAEFLHRVANEVMAEKKVNSSPGIKLGICGDPD
jgi:pyruvate,orthophosphate dikinase